MALARQRFVTDDLSDRLAGALSGDEAFHQTMDRNPGATTPTTPTAPITPTTPTQPNTGGSAPTPTTPTAPTTQPPRSYSAFPDIDRNQLGQAYSTYLGRSMGDADFAAHKPSAGGTQAAV